jgi:hypothetical protein
MITLQKTMRSSSGQIWRDLETAALFGLLFNEETITETLLLALARKHGGSSVAIRAYTKPKEARNGADLEWSFVRKSSSITMRVQAKRLYPNGKYSSLSIKGAQINRLIKSAGATRLPMYVFYNDAGVARRLIGQSAANPCSCDFRPPSYWGCMITHASAVKAAASNKLADLLTGSKPLHCLLCRSGSKKYLPALPDVLADNLTKMPRSNGDDQQIAPTETPTWATRLLSLEEGIVVEPMRRDEATDEYLTSNRLAGVAAVGVNT